MNGIQICTQLITATASLVAKFEAAKSRLTIAKVALFATVAILVPAEAVLAATLQYSLSANRSAPAALNAASLRGTVYIFVPNETGITQVRFYLDVPATGTPTKTEGGAPWDFAGTVGVGNALPYDTAPLSTGTHTMTVLVSYSGAPMQTLSATFTVDNMPRFQLMHSAASNRSAPTPLAGSEVNASTFVFVTPETGVRSVAFYLDGSATASRIETAAPFDFAGTAANGNAVAWNPRALPLGAHSIRAVVTGIDNSVDTINAPFTLVHSCAPLVCSEIKVDLPYVLDFATDEGHLVAGNGIGTGFTYFLPSTQAQAFVPQYVAVDSFTTGRLILTSAAGIALANINNQSNALGVGFPGPAQVATIKTRLVEPPSGTGNYEQAGLWFGYDEDHFFKLVYESAPAGMQIEFSLEAGGQRTYEKRVTIPNQSDSFVELTLLVDPYSQKVSGYYELSGADITQIGGQVTTPPEFFSFDAAGIDPEIGTRSFAGVFATHRNGPAPLMYQFDQFSITAGLAPPASTDAAFARVSHPLPFPTNMVWGPDGRLYVTELFGLIHALTYDALGNVTNDQVITSLVDHAGSRLTLGITIDPISTPSNVILWVSSSSPSVSNGEPNSGMVSRISGPGFINVVDVITGLPRAIANHAPNSLHFGPDGRLYIAIGGNTGAGAPVAVESEFGDRAEQPLTAAIVVADVYAPGFDGTCANTADIYGPAPCDVVPYATGFRNSYDFVFHSNGHMYATDNGLGVTGAFPHETAPPCDAIASELPWDQGGDNPGAKPDLLHIVEQGFYYGHPNPSRNECVFKNGTWQGVAPLPNYRPPFVVLGDHLSADGMVEYTSNAACGLLKGNLLIATYSLGQNVTRVELDAAGTTMVKQSTLVSGLSGPLPITTNPAGLIFVGEFNSDRVTALRWLDPGCWQQLAQAPLSLLNASAGAIGDSIYLVGGRTATGYSSAAYAYSKAGAAWNPIAARPGAAAEQAAAAAVDGKLYVFGGRTASAAAIAAAHVYDPATGAWSTLPALPGARSAAAVALLDGKIYLIGGVDAAGTSVNSVTVFDPNASSYSSVAAMAVARDSAVAAAIGGKLYVFGGRVRSGGADVAATLAAAEQFDPLTGNWSAIADMPDGRRGSSIGTHGGKIQIAGGEVNAANPTGIFRISEQYDPAANTWETLTEAPNARQGAAYTMSNGTLYVIGGGLQSGNAFSNLLESY